MPRAQYDLIAAIEQLYNANGINLDLQIGLFNADHGRDVVATVDRAKQAFAEQPSIQAADVLAWVQYKAGNINDARAAIEQALRTGTRDPLILFHAGMIYKDVGDPVKAKDFLSRVPGRRTSRSCTPPWPRRRSRGCSVALCGQVNSGAQPVRLSSSARRRDSL